MSLIDELQTFGRKNILVIAFEISQHNIVSNTFKDIKQDTFFLSQ